MLKYLSKRYLVYCIDLIGFGMSSHPKFLNTDTQYIIDYFVDSIECWRLEMGFPKILLAGHSFGGYISAMYAIKYPQNLTELVLFSPAGGTKYTQVEISLMYDETVKITTLS
jgi:pimeloyl-ACP methyl ester carboxylesterase